MRTVKAGSEVNAKSQPMRYNFALNSVITQTI